MAMARVFIYIIIVLLVLYGRETLCLTLGEEH
jgi:hypothetical protein